MRGEDCPCWRNAVLAPETPPRAWGRRKPPLEISQLLRNTPTCVGKTSRVQLPEVGGRKHPHVRGEDSIKRKGKNLVSETPPRAWGRRKNVYVAHYGNRNTPTCVGKTPR